MNSRDVNRVPVNRITGYVTRDRFQLTVTDTRKSNCDLRHLAVGPDTRVDRKQIMIKSVHCSRLAYVNKSTDSHRSQPPMGAEHGRSFRPIHPTSHPLSDIGRCTGRPETGTFDFDVCVIEVYSARHHRVPARIRSLPGCPGCRGMRRYAVVGCKCPPLYCTSSEAVFVCSSHLLVSDSKDGNGDRFLTGYNDSMIGYEKIRV